MRTIAIINLKGGVGKTATTVNVAAVLAKDYKQRVLVVDADSQCNATEFFGGDPKLGNFAAVLRFQGNEEFDPLLFAVGSIQRSNFDHIDLLAGDDSLMDLDLTKVETQSLQTRILQIMLERVGPEALDLYDWVLIDCPPAFNAASAAALLAAEEVIIPIKLDAFSLRGMTNMMRQISNMRRINPDLRLDGILPTMWYPSRNIMEAETTLRRSGLPVFGSVIRRSDKVDDMTFAQEPLLVSSPRSAAGVDYRRFVRDLVKGGGVNRCADPLMVRREGRVNGHG